MKSKNEQECLKKVRLKDMIEGEHEALTLVERNNYDGAIKLLADKYRIGPNTKNPKGRNILFIVREGFHGSTNEKKLFKFMESLIKAGADVNCQDKYQLTMLHFAVLEGLPFICKLLLENGANPNLLSQFDRSPLDYVIDHYPSDFGPDCLSVLLLGGADPFLPHRTWESYNFKERLIDRSESINPEHPEEERLRKIYRRTMAQLEIEKNAGVTSSGIYFSKDGILYADEGRKLIRILRNYPSDEVVVPDGVEEIVEGAFSCCSNIKSVIIPESVVSIEQFAFSYCTSLKSIRIPNGVTVIKNGTFEGCWDLQYVQLPDGLTEIEDAAFFQSLSLKSVVIPDSVTDIGLVAFEPPTTIRGKKGSYAESYAEETDHPFRVVRNYYLFTLISKMMKRFVKKTFPSRG